MVLVAAAEKPRDAVHGYVGEGRFRPIQERGWRRLWTLDSGLWTVDCGLWTVDSQAGGRFAAGYAGLGRSRVGLAGLCWGRRRLRRRNGQRAGNKLGG
jgi:hypothetical protein